MNYYEPDAPGPDPIAKATYSPSAGGTLLADLAWYARQQGFQAELTPMNLSELQKYVDRKTPIIVFVSRPGWFINYKHFMVVVGYTSNGLIVNSGLHQEYYISREQFRYLWNRSGQYTLHVTP